jgi:hypothetical protein
MSHCEPSRRIAFPLNGAQYRPPKVPDRFVRGKTNNARNALV